MTRSPHVRPPGRRILVWTSAIAAFFLLGFGLVATRQTLIFLPGTQPGTVNPADNVLVCKNCHNSDDTTRPVNIFKDWQGSMMAQSARDPVFYAALAAANKFNGITGNATGEYCIRCHSPTGWLAGHSEDVTGGSLTGSDYDGVQCDYCHRAIDPLNPDSTAPVLTFPVPGYGNGMHVAQMISTPKRGPIDSVLAPHNTLYYAFTEKSEFCAVCHDVSNVFYAQNRTTQAPHEYAPLERTYSEWLMSTYPLLGDEGTCQHCHMADTSGFNCIYGTAPFRDAIARHDMTGGNSFIPTLLHDFFPGTDTTILQSGSQRAIATLRRAADVQVTAARISPDTVESFVTVTNLTGHKLPTGYPDGRSMWIHIVGRDSLGDTVFQSGAFDADSARRIPDSQAKVYEMIQGLTTARSTVLGIPSGPSLHFSLNDTIFSDNRIPPKGYTYFGFQQRLAQPIGAAYADSQYWDRTRYILPPLTKEVTVELMYQTISRSYVEFLRDQNAGNAMDSNQFGSRLYSSWANHGMGQPVVMNSITVPVTGPQGVRPGPDLPGTLALLQNYPNPFNPSTEIRYQNAGAAHIVIRIYDVTGRTIATLVDELKPPGNHSAVWNASNISSGIYYYVLTAGTRRISRKMLLIK